MAAEDAIKTTVDELVKALSANNIMGQPIDMEDKMIIPVTKMGMGFGTGMNQSNEEKEINGLAGGAGGGVGVFPVALVIVFKGISGPGGVQIVPLTQPSAVAETMAQIASAIISKFSGQKESSVIEEMPHAKKVEIK
ncbi:MAG: hypothetical protein MUO26_13135 [Methanotrichaceae archaeon]|nr:hypothetical protein [Methanotrichaceae archaeon]